MKTVKTGTKVKIQNFNIPNYSGIGTVVDGTPNEYGLVKVHLFREKGFTDFGQCGFYSPSVLAKTK